MFDIVAIGHLINETILCPGKDSQTVLGSPVAYSMACAAALGKRVGIASHIGTDYPIKLLEPLYELGVDMQGVLQTGSQSTNNELVYDSSGRKSIRYLSRAPDIHFDDIPLSYRDARIFYVCPMDWEFHPTDIESLARLPALTAVDLGGFGGAHSPPTSICQMERDEASLRRVVGSVDIVKASDEDCRRIAGDPELDMDDYAGQLIQWGTEVAIITLGAAGALVFTSKQRIHIPPLAGRPLDPTGGGDTFMAGFLVNYLDSQDLLEAARFGAATALHVIEGTGGVVAQRMPRCGQIMARLSRSYDHLKC